MRKRHNWGVETPITRLRQALVEKDLPAILVSDPVNVGYLTGFTGSFGYALITPDGGRFLTDSRYTVQAADEVNDLEVATFGTPKSGIDFILDHIQALNLTRVGFEPSVTYGTWESWRDRLSPIELVPAGDLVGPLRLIKSPEEVTLIRAACHLADACFAHISRLIQPGAVEYDIGLEIEFYFRRHGASLAFDPIVVSGPNSAKPHGKPGERKLAPGDFVTLDFGACLKGYNSDITRTLVVSPATDRHTEIYNRVLEAQVASIEALRPGANGRDIDVLAREILDRDGANLSRYFGHSLGHGLGRSVHDTGRLSVSADQPIAAGQVWTIEPGVYIEGWGGVRIEDDVLVTENGPEVLTHSPKELLALA